MNDNLNGSMEEKLAKSIAYLRERKKYILDKGCKFSPTNSFNTDVAKTMEAYRRDVMREHAPQPVRRVK